jgi:aromatic-L-amino-acid/L-tryptophan decarboxylase
VHDAAVPDRSAESPGLHGDTEAFRRHGHQLVDWVADYLAHVGERPIQPLVEPGEIRAKLPDAAPEDPEPFEAIVRDLDAVVLPGITHWQSPGWFAYFPCNNSGPSILAELVSAGLGVQGMLWATSPACTEIEQQVVDWLADLLGLPEHWKLESGRGGGVIGSSASDSTHLAHVVARHRALERGGATDDLVAYASAQAHSSIEKGARVAGFRHIRLLDVDRELALRPDRLEAAIAQDEAGGLVPAIVTSTVGTTATAAVDPVGAVAEIAGGHGLWHHVDAAYAGSAMICPELRVEQEGIARADSFTVNPHKWMFTNFDCNVLWVADRAPLLDTLSIEPPYLRNAASSSGAVVDYRDWQVPLGRRFRSLKLWWVLRSYGARMIRHHIREHVRLARELADRVDGHALLERVAPASFALVCFRHVAGNESTDALAAAINATATLHVTPSVIGEQHFIRVSVGQSNTAECDVDRLWHVIAHALEEPGSAGRASDAAA